MSQLQAGEAGIINAQEMMLTYLGESGPPQTGDAGIMNIQLLLQQVLAGQRAAVSPFSSMVPPGSTGIGSFSTTGTSGLSTYDSGTGAMNIPNYSAVPVGSTGIISSLFTTSATSGPATYNATTGALSIPTYASGTLNEKVALVTASFSNGTATPQSTGLGFAFTAQVNPCVYICYNFSVSYTASGTLPAVAIMRTTGAIPAAGAGVGSDVTVVQSSQIGLVSTATTLTGALLDTSLTVGTAYNYYAALWCAAGTGPAVIEVVSGTPTGLCAFEVK